MYTYIAKSPIRRLMKNEGANIVSNDALNEIIEILTNKGKELTNKALEMTRHAGRKKLTADDVKLASQVI